MKYIFNGHNALQKVALSTGAKSWLDTLGTRGLIGAGLGAGIGALGGYSTAKAFDLAPEFRVGAALAGAGLGGLGGGMIGSPRFAGRLAPYALGGAGYMAGKSLEAPIEYTKGFGKGVKDVKGMAAGKG